MKYLKLRIRTDDRGVLYEKDVDVRNVFESFLRDMVSTLIYAGIMHQGEHYSAIVVPRYGTHLHITPILSVDTAKVAEQTSWIEMRFEEPVHPDQPVRYFTIELRIQESQRICRQDCQVGDIGEFYVGYGIVQALIKLGVLQNHEIYQSLFFARDDEQAQFDREYIPALEQQANALVELSPEEPAMLAFPSRPLDVYGEVETVGQLEADDTRIIVRRDTLKQLVAEAQKSTRVEVGGILVGNVYESPDGNRHLVEVSDLIVSEHTESNIVELRYTFASWLSHSLSMKHKFPSKRIVGWYHTHLVKTSRCIEENQTHAEPTALFFSRDDVFLHRQFFPDAWYIALVLDPQGAHRFFQWKQGDIVACKGYRIFEDVGVTT